MVKLVDKLHRNTGARPEYTVRGRAIAPSHGERKLIVKGLGTMPPVGSWGSETI